MLAALAMGLIGAGSASAQTPTAAGVLMTQQAEATPQLPPLPAPGPLPPPASCGAQNCLALQISDNALRLLDGGAAPAEFAEGLSLSYEAAGAPLAIYFVAVRYEKGRLARYAYTPWVRPESGEGLNIEGIADVVAEVVDPLGAGEAEIVAASRRAPVWTVPVHTQSFMRESPKTFLAGAPDAAPVDEAAAPGDLLEAAATGTLLLLAFAPADPSRRSPDLAAVTGAVLPISEGN
jgi:hypothetical protein